MILTVWQVLGMFNECDRTINLQSSKGGAPTAACLPSCATRWAMTC